MAQDLFANVPDIILENSRTDGSVNRYIKDKLLGKVRSYLDFLYFKQTILNYYMQGGFAQVYLGQRTTDTTKIAIKIVAKASLVKTRAKQKLQTEIKIHRALSHNNVVKFERFFEDQQYAFLILELCSNNVSII